MEHMFNSSVFYFDLLVSVHKVTSFSLMSKLNIMNS